jgi:predicted ATPase/DNA-binding SARP family transcriptional activator
MQYKDPAPLMIRLFNGIEVEVEGQPLSKPRSRKDLYLLALLALAQGTPMTRSAVAQTLWPFPDHAVDQANGYLRNSLSRLRKYLGRQACRLQASSDHTLRLDLDGAEVDAVAFDRAIRQGNVEALEAAVALYRGPLLHGETDAWVEVEREIYRQRVLKAIEFLSDYARRRNDFPAQVVWLRRGVTLAPTAEALHRALMEALVACGETTAAVLVYRELGDRLHRLCNRAPDPLTTALVHRIQHRPPPPSRSESDTPRGRGEVPYPFTPILGRKEETDSVCHRLEQARLLTLTGTGGVGKTRLAISVGHHLEANYADGVWFVDLADLTASELIPERIAAVLKIDLQTKPELSRLHTLLEHLQWRHALLILDNCEHLHKGAAEIAHTLLTRCGSLRILATSRLALGITGEDRYRVPSLPIPPPQSLRGADAWEQRATFPAVQLFAERASAIRSDFYLHAGNIESIVQICARLDGIPLAIELAAARAGSMSAQQILKSLDRRFSLLFHPSPVVPARQKTLRALIDWSYDLLTPVERTLLARLAVFRGSWDRTAALSICGDGIDPDMIVRGLESLTAHALIQAEPDREEMRYRMLETIRMYAQERLEEADRQDTTGARCRDYFLAFAEEIAPGLRGEGETQALKRLDREHENLREVLTRCLAEPEGDNALKLAGLLWRFWYVRGCFEEGADWLERALARTSNAPDSILVKALSGAGAIAYARLHLTEARTYFARCLAIKQSQGDIRGTAAAMSSLANVAQEEGDYASARALLEEALKVFQKLNACLDIARTLGNLGRVCSAEGDHERALSLHRESVGLFRVYGEGHHLTLSINLMAEAYLDAGDFCRAATCLEESLAQSLVQESRVDQAHSLSCLRRLAVQQMCWVKAAVLLGAETALREAMKAPLSTRDAAEAEKHKERIHACLTAAEFHIAFKAGEAMSPSDVSAFLALPETPPL